MNQRTAKLIRKLAATQRDLVDAPAMRDYKRFWNQTPRPKRNRIRKIWEQAVNNSS